VVRLLAAGDRLTSHGSDIGGQMSELRYQIAA